MYQNHLINVTQYHIKHEAHIVINLFFAEFSEIYLTTSQPQYIQKQSLQEFIQSHNITVTDASISKDYSHISAHDVLKKLLPADVEIPSSFESVGHIIHLNLKDAVLPYKRIIGQVLLDKNPRMKTVINKVGNIQNEYRVFKMELLAGDDNTVAEVKQHGARFKLDFEKVYWNSRLEAEHLRLVNRWFKKGEVVLDAMAGIGPFVIPAAQQGCQVYANDLNPDSYAWLLHNIKLNKVGDKVHPYNIDGREFMRKSAGGVLNVVEYKQEEHHAHGDKKKDGDNQKKDAGQQTRSAKANFITKTTSETVPVFDHVVMNLPATAVEFLDAFNGSFDADMWKDKDLPLVHVYAFLKVDETTDDLQKRIEKALGGCLEDDCEFHDVRNVAPNKHMYCATLRVPRSIAFTDLPDAKRQKT